LAYDSNNDTQAPPDPTEPGGTGAAQASTGDAAAPDAPPVSPAVARFRSCRWQQPAEDGSPEFCTHREVKPYAGTTGFDPDAWCPDCAHYKLRRSPKKRSPGGSWND
jgi:hypothetical protein